MLATPELEIARNLPAEGCSAAEAERYTRWLATHHYENFNVVSWLLPSDLHQHFYNVYAYCRWSDDLGDEIPDRDRALELLDAWEDELRLCYAAGARPVASGADCAARNDSRERYSAASRSAICCAHFGRIRRVQRYATWDDVLDYCVYSANPVGPPGAVSLRLPRRGAAEAF